MKNTVTENFIEEARKLYQQGVLLNPDNEVAEGVLKECLIIEKKDTEYVFLEDSILDLIRNYNIGTFNIGRIHFYSEEDLESTDEYVIVGFEGAGDLIAIDKASHKICCIDGYHDFIQSCSESSEEFLNN